MCKRISLLVRQLCSNHATEVYLDESHSAVEKSSTHLVSRRSCDNLDGAQLFSVPADDTHRLRLEKDGAAPEQHFYKFPTQTEELDTGDLCSAVAALSDGLVPESPLDTLIVSIKCSRAAAAHTVQLDVAHVNPSAPSPSTPRVQTSCTRTKSASSAWGASCSSHWLVPRPVPSASSSTPP